MEARDKEADLVCWRFKNIKVRGEEGVVCVPAPRARKSP